MALYSAKRKGVVGAISPPQQSICSLVVESALPLSPIIISCAVLEYHMR